MPQKNSDKIEHQESQYNLLNNTDLNQSIKSNDDLPKRPVFSLEDNVKSLGYLREYERPDPFKEFEDKLEGLDIRKDALDQKIIRCKRNLLIKHDENEYIHNNINNYIKKSIDKKKTIDRKYFYREPSCILNTSREISNNEKVIEEVGPDEQKKRTDYIQKGIKYKFGDYYKRKYFEEHKKREANNPYVHKLCSKYAYLHDERRQRGLRGAMNLTVYNDKKFKTLLKKKESEDADLNKTCKSKTERSFCPFKTQRYGAFDDFNFWNKPVENKVIIQNVAKKLLNLPNSPRSKARHTNLNFNFFPKINAEEDCHEMNPDLNLVLRAKK